MSVLGESFAQVPEIFATAKSVLAEEIVQFGRVKSRDDYFNVLKDADVVVSTANHEFFGVAMVEAAIFGGCYPLVPVRQRGRGLYSDTSWNFLP